MKRIFVCLVLVCASAAVAAVNREFRCETTVPVGDVRVVRHPAHPAILHSVWRAKDGRVAAVLCNWTRKEQVYDLAAPDIAAAGVLPARSWRIVVK